MFWKVDFLIVDNIILVLIALALFNLATHSLHAKLTNCLSLFDHFVELALKSLTKLEGHIKLLVVK